MFYFQTIIIFLFSSDHRNDYKTNYPNKYNFMKHTFNYCIVFAICLFVSCKKETTESIVVPDEEIKQDRKSTRLNSSHVKISYAVFCLKKKKKNKKRRNTKTNTRTSNM